MTLTFAYIDLRESVEILKSTIKFHNEQYNASKNFGVDDIDILSAIRNHATGNSNMSALDKIIYSSDKIDPLRDYDSSDLIKKCKENYNSGFLCVLKENIKFLKENKKDISNELTDKCIKYYLYKSSE